MGDRLSGADLTGQKIDKESGTGRQRSPKAVRGSPVSSLRPPSPSRADVEAVVAPESGQGPIHLRPVLPPDGWPQGRDADLKGVRLAPGVAARPNDLHGKTVERR